MGGRGCGEDVRTLEARSRGAQGSVDVGVSAACAYRSVWCACGGPVREGMQAGAQPLNPLKTRHLLRRSSSKGTVRQAPLFATWIRADGRLRGPRPVLRRLPGRRDALQASLSHSAASRSRGDLASSCGPWALKSPHVDQDAPLCSVGEAGRGQEQWQGSAKHLSWRWALRALQPAEITLDVYGIVAARQRWRGPTGEGAGGLPDLERHEGPC
jgi:hypothetical protein